MPAVDILSRKRQSSLDAEFLKLRVKDRMVELTMYANIHPFFDAVVLFAHLNLELEHRSLMSLAVYKSLCEAHLQIQYDDLGGWNVSFNSNSLLIYSHLECHDVSQLNHLEY